MEHTVKSKAVFLDRDGTINVEKEYLFRVEDWEWIPGSIEAIKGFNDMGFKVIVVSNQAGVARGYYTERQIDVLHELINRKLGEHGAMIDAFFYCPHHPEFGAERDCECRKPKSGLILDAIRKYNINDKESYMVGDKASDIMAGRRANLTCILVMTGYGAQHAQTVGGDAIFADDLLSALRIIKEIESSRAGADGR